MQHNGYVIDDMFFGLWLLPLSYLVIRSGYFPKILGVLQVFAGLGYLTGMAATLTNAELGKSVTLLLTVPPGRPGS
jgi:Domain of unknown function (DUF4386)